MNQTIKIALVSEAMLVRQCLITLLHAQKNMHVLFNAESKDQALSHLKYKQPDILVVSAGSYLQDAFDLLQALKSFPNIRPIVLIEEENDALILALLEQDVKAILSKTADINSLARAIMDVQAKGFYYTEEVTQAIDRRLEGLSSVPVNYDITSREAEVLHLVCRGKSSRQIAALLFISIKTVEHHRSNLLKKTNSKNRFELRKWASLHNYASQES